MTAAFSPLQSHSSSQAAECTSKPANLCKPGDVGPFPVPEEAGREDEGGAPVVEDAAFCARP
ncbi:hypothetical protein PMIN06_003190 [Paraphaeosphaeria minitans]